MVNSIIGARLRIMTALFVIVLMAVLCSYASAAQISYSSAIPTSYTDWTKTISVQQFNPYLGTLNSVLVTYSVNWQSTFSLENWSTTTTSGVYRVTISGTLGLVGPNNETLVSKDGADRYMVSSFIPVGIFDGTADYSGSDSYTTSLAFSETGTSTPTDLSTYIGHGTVAYTASTLTWVSESLDGGSPHARMTTTADGSVNVLYDYTTPEPGSMLALLTGLVGLIGMATRRRH